MPACCRGQECEFPNITDLRHKCLTCPTDSNLAHAVCTVEVRRVGAKVVRVGAGDDPPTDKRYIPDSLLSTFGRQNISFHVGGDGGSRGNTQSEVCKSCWNRHARQPETEPEAQSETEPRRIADPSTPAVKAVLEEYVNGEGSSSVRKEAALNSFRMWFKETPPNDPRSRAFFETHIYQTCVDGARGSRGGRGGGGPGRGGPGRGGRGGRGNQGFDLAASLEDADRREGVARGAPPMDRGDVAASAPSARLLRLRENFTPTGVKKKAKAEAAQKKKDAAAKKKAAKTGWGAAL